MITPLKSKAIQAVNSYRERERERHKYILAVAGNNAGILDVPGRVGFVYMRLRGEQNQVVEVQADASVPLDVNNPYIVEEIHRRGGTRYRIKGIAAEVYGTDPRSNLPGRHGVEHERDDMGVGGSDPVELHPRMWISCRAQSQAVPDWTLRICEGWYKDTAGLAYHYAGGNSPTFFPPAAWGSVARRCDLLYFDAAHVATILQGTDITIDGSEPTQPTIPDPCTPIAFVYLDSTQVALNKEALIREPRLFVGSSASGGGGHVIQDEGTPLTTRTNLNFVGAGVTATDDAPNNATVVTIPGGTAFDLPATIHAASAKSPPVANDEFPIADSAATYGLKKVLWSAITGALDLLYAAIGHTHAQLHTQGTDVALGALSTKNPPIDADKVIYRDSVSSDALVTSTWTQIKAFLKTYFDGIYSALGHTHSYLSSALTSAHIFVGNGSNVATDVAMSSDATLSNTGALTIANGAITLAKQADMATASLVYRKSAGNGAPEVNSLATLKTDLGLTGTNSGDQTITLTGDVTGSGTGSFAATIANAAVTLAKMANMATASLIYRKTAGAGAPEVNSLATLKTDLALTGTNGGDVTLGAGNFAALALSGQQLTLTQGTTANTVAAGNDARFGAASVPTWGRIFTTMGA